ncbi:hypothetical protein CAMSH0001_1335 [Campylobacter showae RM3277]|uniref:Uncharacterized protein n=1 Tax=Campylobacter showae RM3277 TaxID=553219 RepID=C6RII8_9BACT|nr:hypothetical protein CAMSH0001_1335 [Campylobacter showae RM3277]
MTFATQISAIQTTPNFHADTAKRFRIKFKPLKFKKEI